MCGYYSRQDALVYARLDEGTDGVDSGLEAIEGAALDIFGGATYF